MQQFISNNNIFRWWSLDGIDEMFGQLYAKSFLDGSSYGHARCKTDAVFAHLILQLSRCHVGTCSSNENKAMLTWSMHRCQDSGQASYVAYAQMSRLGQARFGHNFKIMFLTAICSCSFAPARFPKASWYGVCLLAASRRIGRLLRFEGHQPFHPRHSPRSPDRLHGDTLGRRRWGLFRRWHPPLPFGNIVYRAGSRPRIAPCTRWLHGAAGKKREHLVASSPPGSDARTSCWARAALWRVRSACKRVACILC